jgi:hypothetical protein
MLLDSATGIYSRMRIFKYQTFRYPNIEMNHTVEDPEDAAANRPTNVHITLEREADLAGDVIGKILEYFF